jgi:hypothetical protein
VSRYPDCYVCNEPCVAGQVDALGFPVHLGCQASLPPEERNERLAEWSTSSFGPRREDREEER